jgi:hypothetical protein
MKIKSIAANQTEITLSNGTIIFVSYETPVAAFVAGRGVLLTSNFYSRTTKKHVNAWVKNTFSRHVTVTVVAQDEIESFLG